METDFDTTSREEKENLVDEIGSLVPQLNSLCRDEAVLETQAHLAAIVEYSDDAIISKSLDGTIRTWNKSAENLFGYTSEEMVGQSINLLIPVQYRTEEAQFIARLRTGEKIDHCETRRIRRDGTELEVIVVISPIKDYKGQIIGASKNVRSVAAQKRAQQALLDSEARLRAVVDNAVDGIITFDEIGLIESINGAGTRTFGYDESELIGKNVNMLMPEPHHQEHDSDLSNFRTTAKRALGIGRDVMGRRKNGATFPVDLGISEVSLGDRRIFTGFVRDITDRKDAEKAILAAKEAAEAASRAKEHFLSVLSHELRTPLAPMLAEMSYLEEDPGVPEPVRSSLKLIRRNVEMEARLVDDLLDLTHITRGKVQLHFEVADLHDLIQSTLTMFRRQIEDKSLEIQLALRAKEHHIWADPGRMQQIVVNLLSNAVKFTPENGTITLRSSNRQPQMIEIELSDSGVGIDEVTLPLLFNAFEQGDRARHFGGLGLGLSIARSLTELHAGKLTAFSEGRNKGSTFLLQLNNVSSVKSAVRSTEPPLPLKLDLKILLVEDHEDTRTVTSRILKSLGCDVVTAASVHEAIEIGQAQSFDLLISDIGLPDGTGLEIMEHFRQKKIRGIALSGFGQEEDLRRSREAGFEVHLTKPLNVKTLKETLRNLN